MGEDEAARDGHQDESSLAMIGRSSNGERLGPAINRPCPQAGHRAGPVHSVSALFLDRSSRLRWGFGGIGVGDFFAEKSVGAARLS